MLPVLLRHQPDAAAERADRRVGQRRLVIGFGVARLAVERQRDAERNAVLRQHQIGGLQNVVALDHALVAGERDRLDLRAGKAVLGLEVAHRLDRGMRGSVARIALQHGARDDKLLAEAAGQFADVPFRAEHLEEPELAFEHGARPGETVGGKAGRQDTRFRSPPEMQPLDHAAVAAGELQQSAAQRPGDAERVGHRRRIEPQQMAGGDRPAERAGGARRMKAAGLVGVPGRAPDPDHHLVAGDKGGDQRRAVGAAFLGDGEGGGQHRRAGMRAGTGPGQAVKLEGMGERAIGERRSRRLDRRPTAAEDMAFAAGAGTLGIIDDDAAPRQGAAANARSDSVDDALLGLLHDRRGEILVAKSGGIFGEPDGFLRHGSRPPFSDPLVMPGLDPGIHATFRGAERSYGFPGRARQ